MRDRRACRAVPVDRGLALRPGLAQRVRELERAGVGHGRAVCAAVDELLADWRAGRLERVAEPIGEVVAHDAR